MIAALRSRARQAAAAASAGRDRRDHPRLLDRLRGDRAGVGGSDREPARQGHHLCLARGRRAVAPRCSPPRSPLPARSCLSSSSAPSRSSSRAGRSGRCSCTSPAGSASSPGRWPACSLFAAIVLAAAEAITWVAARLIAPSMDIATGDWISVAALGDALADYASVLFWVTGYALLGMTVAVLVRSVPLALGIGIAWAGPVEHIIQDAWSPAEQPVPGTPARGLRRRRHERCQRFQGASHGRRVRHGRRPHRRDDVRPAGRHRVSVAIASRAGWGLFR